MTIKEFIRDYGKYGDSEIIVIKNDKPDEDYPREYDEELDYAIHVEPPEEGKEEPTIEIFVLPTKEE